MATGSATRIYHSTASTTADTVTLALVSRVVTVVNRGAGNLFVTAGTDKDVPATPVAAAAETWVVPANSERNVPVDGDRWSASNSDNPTQTVVKVIADTGTPAYTVIAN